MADIELIVKMPEELAEKGHWYTDEEMWTVIKAAQNGTPIPDNVTNGDILKTIIPMENYYGDERAIQFYHYIEWDFPKWWNAPYQKGGKE